MALNTGRPFIDATLNVSGAAITGGFTVSLPVSIRGEIVAVFLAPADGGAITGSATLTVSVNNTSVGTVAMAASSAGFASGGATAFSPRAFVKQGDAIKLVLGAGMTNATAGEYAVVIRQRTA